MTPASLNPFRRSMRDRLVFIHVPRCAGSSLRTAMASHFPARDRLRISPPAARFVSAFSTERPKRVRELLFLYFLEQGDHRFLTGHFSFSEAGYERAAGKWKFVSMIRHPVDRWLSSYFYRRHSEGDRRRTDLELAEFLASDRARSMGRRIVRAFCGDVDERADPAAAVERAKENVAKLDLVGVLSRLDAFLDRYRGLFGVRPRVPRVNTSPLARAERDRSVTPEIRAEVERLCAPDLELYAFVEEKLAP